MAFQINIFQVLLLVLCITYVFCDCYRESDGCKDPDRKRQYRVGQRWKPKTNTCYTCRCMRRKIITLTCKVAVDDSLEEASSKKSSLSAKLREQKNAKKDTFIKLWPKKAKAKKCPPTKAPTFNWTTFTFEELTYRTVNYFYYKRESRCCNRFMTYSSVHPSCEVVKVGKCRSKVVQKSDPKKLCYAPMSLVG